jgi:UTP--glucose-1-phosphate uridylyltransferase
MSKVLKAVIPVAGLGTRMLPATKAIPKEMLPIVDKPLIQYVVNEAISAGIKEIVLVTHSSKNAIENHFDTSFELEATLEKRVKRQLLDDIQSICPKDVTIIHVLTLSLAIAHLWLFYLMSLWMILALILKKIT